MTPGESLWSIAAANGLSVETLAASNGLAADSLLLIGQTIQVPATSGSAADDRRHGAPPPSPPYWTAPIYCPCGEVYLASNAAAAWEAMRQESLRLYGTDLYPDGTLSGYRSYAQQLYLYNLYLSGQGSLAARPGDLLPRVRLRTRPRRALHAHRGRPDRRQLRLGEDRGPGRVVAHQLRRA